MKTKFSFGLIHSCKLWSHQIRDFYLPDVLSGTPFVGVSKVSYCKDKGCYGLLSAGENLGPGCYTVRTPDWSYFPKNNFSKFS